MPYWYTAITPALAASCRVALAKTLRFDFSLTPALRAVRSQRDALRLLRDSTHFAYCRWQHKRPLLKDPLALLSAPWLADTFGLKVIVLVRHPAAFSYSLQKAGWVFPFSHLAAQTSLMEERLAPYAARIREYASTPPSILEQAVLLWNILHQEILHYQQTYPVWYVVRHEDLAAAPETEFAALYRYAEEDFCAHAQRITRAYSAVANPIESRRAHSIRRHSLATTQLWKSGLTPAEIAYVRRATEAVASQFYQPHEW